MGWGEPHEPAGYDAMVEPDGRITHNPTNQQLSDAHRKHDLPCLDDAEGYRAMGALLGVKRQVVIVLELDPETADDVLNGMSLTVDAASEIHTVVGSLSFGEIVDIGVV